MSHRFYCTLAWQLRVSSLSRRRRRRSFLSVSCVSGHISGLTLGWFCQHHSKSPWLSRRCFSRSSSCRGCLASAVAAAAAQGRRKLDSTLATPEKVGVEHYHVCPRKKRDIAIWFLLPCASSLSPLSIDAYGPVCADCRSQNKSPERRWRWREKRFSATPQCEMPHSCPAPLKSNKVEHLLIS